MRLCLRVAVKTIRTEHVLFEIDCNQENNRER
jgi:hypothetical protein